MKQLKVKTRLNGMVKVKVKVKVKAEVEVEVEVKFLPIQVHPLGLVIEYAKHFRKLGKEWRLRCVELEVTDVLSVLEQVFLDVAF